MFAICPRFGLVRVGLHVGYPFGDTYKLPPSYKEHIRGDNLLFFLRPCLERY